MICDVEFAAEQNLEKQALESMQHVLLQAVDLSLLLAVSIAEAKVEAGNFFVVNA